MDIQQVTLYCDPSLAIQETCCEIPGAQVRSEAFRTTTVMICRVNTIFSLFLNSLLQMCLVGKQKKNNTMGKQKAAE